MASEHDLKSKTCVVCEQGNTPSKGKLVPKIIKEHVEDLRNKVTERVSLGQKEYMPLQTYLNTHDWKDIRYHRVYRGYMVCNEKIQRLRKRSQVTDDGPAVLSPPPKRGRP